MQRRQPAVPHGSLSSRLCWVMTTCGEEFHPPEKERCDRGEVSSQPVKQLPCDWGVKMVLVLWDHSILKGFVADIRVSPGQRGRVCELKTSAQTWQS